MVATAGPSTWMTASRQSPPPDDSPTHSMAMLSPPVNATRPSHTSVLRWLRRISAQNRGRQKRYLWYAMVCTPWARMRVKNSAGVARQPT